MAKTSVQFGQLLTQAIYRIRSLHDKPIQIIQDELGYALGRDSGGSAIEYWRKGNVPEKVVDVEQLARQLVQRTDLGRDWLEKFLRSASHPQPQQICNELLPELLHAAAPAVGLAQATLASLVPLADFAGELAPFVVGPPVTHVRQFFGRESELRRVFGSLGRLPMQHIALVGPPRSGKTSLLHYIKTITAAPPAQLRPEQRRDWLPHPERYRWVFVDFQDIRMVSQESLLRHMLAELGMAAPEPCNLIAFMETVSRQLSFPAVVLMDEIGAALDADELDIRFWSSLRSLGTNQTGGKLSFIITSHQAPKMQAELAGKPSPFFNIFQRLNVGPLSEAAARELIASSPHPLAPADADWVLAESRGWPALVQLLCQTHMDWSYDGAIDPEWRDEGLRQLAAYRYLFEG